MAELFTATSLPLRISAYRAHALHVMHGPDTYVFAWL